ncbi:hypothetical protein ACOSQ4_027549 [Xanthoceras sorbifolium]
MFINIGEKMFLTVLNVIMSMSWGGSLHREDRNKVGIQLRQIAEEFVDLWGAPNISDLFPMLARFDLQGVESKMKKLSSWFDRFFEEQEGRERKQGLSGDLVGVDAEKDDKSSLFMNQVKALLLVLGNGRIATTSRNNIDKSLQRTGGSGQH